MYLCVIGDYDLSNCQWATPYVVGSFIKKFFAKLLKPLIPYYMHPSLIEVASEFNYDYLSFIIRCSW